MNNLPPKPSWMSDADYREHAERRARLDAAEWLSPDDVAKDWDVPQPEERPNGHAAPSKGAGAANSEAPDPRKIAFTPYAWRAPETLAQMGLWQALHSEVSIDHDSGRRPRQIKSRPRRGGCHGSGHQPAWRSGP